MRQFRSFRKKSVRAVRVIGIYDESDVERVVHEYRREGEKI
jgi:hypothetical protein